MVTEILRALPSNVARGDRAMREDPRLVEFARQYEDFLEIPEADRVPEPERDDRDLSDAWEDYLGIPVEDRVRAYEDDRSRSPEDALADAWLDYSLPHR